MLDIDSVKKEIVAKLKPLDPENVILFGSYAWGTPREDSDIDLYVVTKDNFMPKNFNEKSKIFLKWITELNDLNCKYGVDLITHTKPMHEKFLDMDSMFSRKIMRDGVRLV